MSIFIYEFRRGFSCRLQGESWVSTGFYGPKYVGITFQDEQIPTKIIQAIDSQAFEVSQFVDIPRFRALYRGEKIIPIGSQEFNHQFVSGIALVGRIIDNWAVLAVITGAIDFSARYFPVQRYFCCQESPDYDAMATLIVWWTENWEAKKLIFDICDNIPAQIYNYQLFTHEELPPEDGIDIAATGYENLHLISPGAELSKNYLLKIWSNCLHLTNNIRQQPAWAFNIHDLKQPEYFTLVQAGTTKFFDQYIFRLSSPSEKIPKKTLEKILAEYINKGSLSTDNIAFLKQEINLKNSSQKLLPFFNQFDFSTSEESSIIRLLFIQALFNSEKAIDLFQRLIWFDREDSWSEFWQAQKSLKDLKSDVQETAQEGIWLIINQIIEREVKLPVWRALREEFFSPGFSESKFFNQPGFWTDALSASLTEILNKYEFNTSPNSNQNQQKIFLDNLKKRKYISKHKNGYKTIIGITQKAKFSRKYFLQALISNQVYGHISYELFNFLKSNQPYKNYPKFIRSLNKPNSRVKLVRESSNNFIYLPRRFRNSVMRNWLQFLFGILAAIIGWNISQIFLVDLQPFWQKTNFTFFLEFPYIVRFITVTTFLAIAMVMAEIFLSHPTRIKAGLRVIRPPFLIAIGLSLAAGLISTGISFVLKLPLFSVSPWFIRLADWLIIGLAVGLAEGATWYLRLILREEPNSEQVRKHLLLSGVMGLFGSAGAFWLSEKFSNQELISLIFLGGLLGFLLSFVVSPSAQLALRAGFGFEPRRVTENSPKSLLKNALAFTNNPRSLKIEEGVSIKLPTQGELLIGSDEKADIFVSALPRECAKIILKNRKAWLKPCGGNGITIKNRQILISPCDNPEEQGKELLKHNQIITLYTENNNTANTGLRQYVRFVFYDRFLDPEA